MTGYFIAVSRSLDQSEQSAACRSPTRRTSTDGSVLADKGIVSSRAVTQKVVESRIGRCHQLLPNPES